MGRLYQNAAQVGLWVNNTLLEKNELQQIGHICLLEGSVLVQRKLSWDDASPLKFQTKRCLAGVSWWWRHTVSLGLFLFGKSMCSSLHVICFLHSHNCIIRILPLWQDKHLLNNSGPSPLIYVTVIHEFIPWCITRNQSTAHTSNQSSSLLSLNQVLVMYQPQLLWRQPPSPSVDAFEAYRWELQWSCSASENYCVRSKMDVKKASVSGEANINEETDGNTVTFEKDLIYSTPFHTIFLRPIEVVKSWYPVPWSVQHYDPSAIPEE